MIENFEQQLSDYGNKIWGESYGLTMERLIDSYRHLSLACQRYEAERLEIFRTAKAQGHDAGVEAVTHCEYISVQKLKDMTIQELTDFMNQMHKKIQTLCEKRECMKFQINQ